MLTGMTDALDAMRSWLPSHWDGQGLVLALTGAGISAESGIPTFRGEEGYWRVGSRNYFPEQLATHEAFTRMPDDIWGWYLYRRSICRAAQPNRGHHALVQLEQALGASDRFVLVTQNVDGLHLRAGNSAERTYQIHGNIDYMRAVHDRDARIFPLPESLGETWQPGRALGPEERALLVSPHDGTPARPHVLWFDESYDEARFHFESALAAIERAGLVIVVGTSGSTTLPNMIVQRAYEHGVPFVVINREPSPFTQLAEQADHGYYCEAGAGDALPSLIAAILDTAR
jgi:NAD-dependent deacetylase